MSFSVFIYLFIFCIKWLKLAAFFGWPTVQRYLACNNMKLINVGHLAKKLEPEIFWLFLFFSFF